MDFLNLTLEFLFIFILLFKDTNHAFINDTHCRDSFSKYARFCFERWGSKVKHWITFNEIHTFAISGYMTGVMAPGRCSAPVCVAGNSDTEPYIVAHHALLSHAHAVDIYRKEFKVSKDESFLIFVFYNYHYFMILH